MSARKTQYVVNFSADPQAVNSLVVNWLNANGFKYMEKYDCRFYRLGDGIWTTSRCFEYYFQGNQLIIYAYLKTPKKPFPLDNGMVGALNTTPYINMINELIAAVNNLSANYNQYNQNMVNNQGAYQSINQYGQPQQAIANNQFGDMAEKRNRNSAIGALAIGLLNVAIMFIGNAMGYILNLGWIFMVVGYMLAFQGLKSKDKAIAISALVILTISLVINLMQFAGYGVL